jgi:CHAT domain-containing protein
MNSSLCLFAIFGRNMKYIVAFLLLLAVSDLVQAQQEKLNRQLQAYEVKFKNLMATRGLSYNEGKVSQNKIEDVVYAYSQKSDGTVDKTLGLLFYHFENDTLYHWLFNYEKLEATASLPLTIDSLIALENTIKFSLKIDAALATRAAYSNNKKFRLRSYEALPLAATVLFPAPIQKALIGKRHLIILPILNLSSFPFAMLKPWGTEQGTLIDSLSFSFAHNFTQFFQSVERNAMSYDGNYTRTADQYSFQLKDPLVVGNPAFMDSCTRNLEQLPGAEREAKRVAELMHMPAWTGQAANRNFVLDKVTSSNFVYLATHGWADPDKPLDGSFIALSGGQDCGYLTPRQIQSLELAGKPIVILSACP